MRWEKKATTDYYRLVLVAVVVFVVIIVLVWRSGSALVLINEVNLTLSITLLPKIITVGSCMSKSKVGCFLRHNVVNINRPMWL